MAYPRDQVAASLGSSPPRKLLMPGEAEYTLEVVLGYLLRGFEAHQKMAEVLEEKGPIQQ